MKKQHLLFYGLGLGAGLMYMLDPDRGRKRRALVRDRVNHSIKVTGRTIDKTSRDLGNRAGGVFARLSGLLRDERVNEDVLAARVRAGIGRILSHPAAVSVRASGRKITLEGPVLAAEAGNLIKCASAVRGVREVEDRLEIHEETENVPALQGGGPHPGQRLPFMQENWSPTTRLLVGAAGGALAAYGIARRGVVGVACEIAGAGCLARAMTNREIKSLIGVRGSRGTHIQKTINIDAPVEKVFDFWTRHENFPTFMTHVREVRDLGDGRYHWKVEGPGGVPLEWVGKVIEQVPNEMQRWESVPGSAIEQSGTVRFQSNEDGGTRIDIKLNYNPPAGMIGHAVASLFGVDPKAEIDDDLMRMKSFIETGQPPRDAAQPETRSRTVSA